MMQDGNVKDDLPTALSYTEIKNLVSRAMAKSDTITPVCTGIRINGDG